MDNYPFPVQPELTAIAIAVANQAQDYIAERVSPRVPVGSPTFKYQTFTTKEHYTIPRTEVGRKGKVNEVDFTSTETSASTTDYALDDPIPISDIEAAANNPGLNPVEDAVEKLTDLVMLDRENRVATDTFTAGNYASGNKVTLSGTDQWSDYTNSDPISDIQTAIETPLVPPNGMVLGQQTWTKLRAHPDIAKAVHGNAGDKGLAAQQAVADLFELDWIAVGKARKNTANMGQTASYSRTWGKHAALLYVSSAPRTDSVSWGWTAQWGDRFSGQMSDSTIGARGGQRVRSGESVKEVIACTDCGYLITDAVA